MGAFIARIGQSATFIAFNAHWGFAFFVMASAARMHSALWLVASLLVVLAAVKEFWFDPKYEVDQSRWPDGAEDFAGYAFGIALGAWLLDWSIK